MVGRVSARFSVEGLQEALCKVELAHRAGGFGISTSIGPGADGGTFDEVFEKKKLDGWMDGIFQV